MDHLGRVNPADLNR
jgi:hypothetical protein